MKSMLPPLGDGFSRGRIDGCAFHQRFLSNACLMMCVEIRHSAIITHYSAVSPTDTIKLLSEVTGVSCAGSEETDHSGIFLIATSRS